MINYCDMDVFSKFQHFNKIFNYHFKGVDVARVMQLELYYLASNKSLPFSRKGCFVALSYADLAFDKEQNEILSVIGMTMRKDHTEVYDYILGKLDGKASRNVLAELKLKYCCNIHAIYKSFKAVFLSFSNAQIPFWEKTKFAILATVVCNNIIELHKCNFTGVQKFLSMHNSMLEENLLTQFMKLKNIPTYSLSEGAGFIEKRTPGIDTVNYMNLESDYLLTWGQYTVDEYVSYGIRENRLLVAGYPHQVTISQMKPNNKFKKCFVLLSRIAFENSNYMLLDILSKLSHQYDFYVKLHPTCDYDKYSRFCEQNNMNIISKDTTISECLNNDLYDFGIAVNTNTYYESLIRGVPCLRFSDGTFTLMYGNNDIFSNMQELNQVLDSLINMPIEEYQKQVDVVLEYTLGMGQDNYKKILLGHA